MSEAAEPTLIDRALVARRIANDVVNSALDGGGTGEDVLALLVDVTALTLMVLDRAGAERIADLFKDDVALRFAEVKQQAAVMPGTGQ